MQSDVTVRYDQWMGGWANIISSVRGEALDVGCGPGFDTEVLAGWGFEVTASDYLEAELGRSKERNVRVPHVLADARSLEPFGDAQFVLVIASLSLHYFDRKDTHRAFAAIARVLREGGLFVFRVNAWDDFNFGATKNRSEWETVLHRNVLKQFFSDEMVQEVLAGRFEEIEMKKLTTTRYGKEKSFVACICRKAAQPGATDNPDGAQ